MGFFEGTSRAATLNHDETCKLLLCTNNFRNSPDLAFYRIPKARSIQREYVRLLRNCFSCFNPTETSHFTFRHVCLIRSCPPTLFLFNRYILYASNSLHHPLKQTTGAAGYVRRAAPLGHNPLPQN